MSVLVYVISGLSIAAGALAAVWWVRTLTSVGPAAKRGGRREIWNNAGLSLGLVLVGTLLLLSVHDQTASRLAAVAATALLIWQLAAIRASHARRRSVS